MANTNITTVEASGFIPQIWLGVALGRLRNYLTIAKTVTRDTDIAPGAFRTGSTLLLPKRGALTVNDKVQNNNYTVQNPTSTDITLTLSKHKEVTFGVESRAISTSNQDIISGYVEDAVIALAEQIDADLLTFAATATTNPVIVGGAGITEANVLTARKALVDNKVGALVPKFAIIPTSQTNALLQIDRLVRYDALGVSNNISDATVGNGVRTIPASIGKLYNFEAAESQLAPYNGTVYSSLFYSKDAILFAMRELEIPDEKFGVYGTVMTDQESGLTMRLLHGYNLSAGAHQVTLDVLYGYAFQRPEHIIVETTTA